MKHIKKYWKEIITAGIALFLIVSAISQSKQSSKALQEIQKFESSEKTRIEFEDRLSKSIASIQKQIDGIKTKLDSKQIESKIDAYSRVLQEIPKINNNIEALRLCVKELQDCQQFVATLAADGERKDARYNLKVYQYDLLDTQYQSCLNSRSQFDDILKPAKKALKKKKPLLSLVTAVAIGFIAGKLLK